MSTERCRSFIKEVCRCRNRLPAAAKREILMTYIGSETLPAPTLNQVDLVPHEAEQLFRQSMKYIELMLAHDRIHADYSAYNMLYWEGKLWVIDFPQAVHPNENRNAFSLLERDVLQICNYFTVQGVQSEPKRLADQIWKNRFGRRRMDVHRGLLDAEDEEDRAIWDSLTDL